MDWYIAVLKKYTEFSGRASRQEYWMFTLINTLVYVVLALIGRGSFALMGLYSLGTFLPAFAVMFRRLHDTGRSGWWMFISFVPLIGGLIFLYFLICDSDEGFNDYGANPKHVDESE